MEIIDNNKACCSGEHGDCPMPANMLKGLLTRQSNCLQKMPDASWVSIPGLLSLNLAAMDSLVLQAFGWKHRLIQRCLNATSRIPMAAGWPILHRFWIQILVWKFLKADQSWLECVWWLKTTTAESDFTQEGNSDWIWLVLTWMLRFLTVVQVIAQWILGIPEKCQSLNAIECENLDLKCLITCQWRGYQSFQSLGLVHKHFYCKNSSKWAGSWDQWTYTGGDEEGGWQLRLLSTKDCVWYGYDICCFL